MVSLKVYLELFKAAVAIAALSLVCIGFTVLVICFMLQLFDKCRSSIAPIVIIVGMVMSALSAIVEMVLVAVLGFTSSLCKDLLSIATTSATPLKACSPLYVGYVGAFIYVLISLALIVVLMLIILICPPKDTEERMQQKTSVQPPRHRDSDSRRVQHSERSVRQPSSRSTRNDHSQKQNARSERQYSNKSAKNASGRSSRSQKLNRFRI